MTIGTNPEVASFTWASAVPGISAAVVGLRGFRINPSGAYLTYSSQVSNFSSSGGTIQFTANIGCILNAIQFEVLATTSSCQDRFQLFTRRTLDVIQPSHLLLWRDPSPVQAEQPLRKIYTFLGPLLST